MSGMRLHIVVAVLPLLVGGCSWFGKGESRPQQLNAEAFYRPVPGAEDRQELSTDRSGAIRDPYGNSAAQVAGPINGPRTPTAVSRTPATVPANVESAILPPSTAPAVNRSQVPALGAAQYQTVGAIVVDVSGTPIFADKVVQSLAPALAVEARQRGIDEFRGFATVQINKKVQDLVQSELLYAAAMKNLTNEEKDRAWALTGAWKASLQRESGGSIEMARKKYQDQGINFDEMVNDRHRVTLVYMYQNKRLFPKVPVTAQEMRRYYDEHVSREFTDVDQAQFRVIKIMVARSTGETMQQRRENALNTIKQIRQGLVDRSDADFAKAASEKNDDALLMKNGGRVGVDEGWMQRGSYAVTKVEEAVWKLQPGQLTDVIESPNGDAYYIARLSDRKLSHTRPFEDPDVQLQIMDSIRKPQIAALQAKMIDDLMRDAIVTPENVRDWRIAPVFEMVMQMYPTWVASK